MMPPMKAATMMSAMSPAMPTVSLYQTGNALFRAPRGLPSQRSPSSFPDSSMVWRPSILSPLR